LNPEHLTRYLKILGVQKQKPSMAALNELVRAHLLRIPFENLSKLYYNKECGLQGIPGLELYLEGIEHFHFGGTCYSNNFHFNQLLASLDYRIKLCGAGMNNPDVHMVSIVSIANREYLVDVGYAAPFMEPLPRDLTSDYMISLGRDRYILKPQDDHGRSQVELHRHGSLKQRYVVDPAPRHLGEFKHIIDDSFGRDSTFMNTLLMVRFFPDCSLVLHNLTLIESRGTQSRSQALKSRDDLIRAIHEHFSISRELSEPLIMRMELSGDAWS
jgi:arylamine N-acetyltransferase